MALSGISRKLWFAIWINAIGEVTRLVGVDAEPEPRARRPKGAVSKSGD